MREIVNVQVGQCGNQIASKVCTYIYTYTSIFLEEGFTAETSRKCCVFTNPYTRVPPVHYIYIYIYMHFLIPCITLYL